MRKEKHMQTVSGFWARILTARGKQIRPGIVKKDQEGKVTCRPILSRIVSLQAEQNDLEYAVPGGLIGHTPPPRSPRFLPSVCLFICLCLMRVKGCLYIG